jgi:hypothetical protein
MSRVLDLFLIRAIDVPRNTAGIFCIKLIIQQKLIRPSMP